MFACVDVDYREHEALAACVLFRDWLDEAAEEERVERIIEVAPYEPGMFYKRELPCLLAVLKPVRDLIEAVIVDGYVWLQDDQTPGLGAHLHEALDRSIPVIGVAKTSFLRARKIAQTVFRGGSQRPLFVTAVGMDVEKVCQHIKSMHGTYRIPTLLKRVDQLCRYS